MALSDKQVSWLEDFFEAARLHEGKLSDWERKFVADVEERFDKYAADLNISPKQGNVLRRTWNKMMGTGDRDDDI